MILFNKIEPILNQSRYPFIWVMLVFVLSNLQPNGLTAQCNSSFIDHAGNTTNYGTNRNDITTFTAPTGSAVKVSFTSFNTEAGYDKLFVYDGPNTSSNLIATLQGTTIPNDITSSGETLTFKFTSDGSVQFPGWEADITCVSNTFDCNSPKFSFINPTLLSGTANTVGAVYSYGNIIPGVDGRLSIVSKTHSDISILSVDEAAASYGGYDDAIQPIIDYNFLNADGSLDPAGNKSVTFKVDFKKANTNIDTILSLFTATGIDIDGSTEINEIKEYLSTSNHSSRAIGSTSALTLSGNIKALGPITNYPNISQTDFDIMISFNYENKSSVTFTYGANYGGAPTLLDSGLPNSDEQRLNSIYFKCYDLPNVFCNTTPNIPSVTNGTICGGGSTTLEATVANAFANAEWFTSASGGSPVHIGSSYTTPYLTSTTTYYVQANLADCISARIPVVADVSTCETDYFDCTDGKSIDMKYIGLKNSVPITFDIGSTTDMDSVLVEIVYKISNPGSTITVKDDANNIYTASRVNVGNNAYVYSFILPPTSTVKYENQTNENNAQSLNTYSFKSNQPGATYVSQFTSISGHANTKTLDFSIPSRSGVQDVIIQLPISEVTYDDRSLTFTATMGSVTKTVTRLWGPNGEGFPNECCIDDIEIILEDVPASVTDLSVDIISPGGGAGQSYVVAGLVFVEVQCFPDEICENGIDDDNDGLTDCEDIDCGQILNREFDKGATNWFLYNQSGNSSTVSIDQTWELSGQNSAFIDLTASNGTTLWHTQFGQSNLSIEYGKTYEVYFDIKAATNKNVALGLQLGYSPYTNYFYQNLTATTTAVSHKYTFVASDTKTNELDLIFNLGIDATDVWIDNVQLKESCAIPGNDEVFLESECSDIGVNISQVSDPTASNGEYLVNNGATVSTPGNTDDYVRFYASVSNGGLYNIFGRTITSSVNNDSWFVRVNDGDWVLWNNIPVSTTWQWNQVWDSPAGNTPVSFEFETGINTIDFNVREPGAKLDKIYLTGTNVAPTGSGGSPANCPQKFLCDSKFYQTIEVGGDYWLYQLQTDPMGHIPLVNLNDDGIIGGINSTVFNRYDGYIYTMNMNPPYRLYRIAGDYSTHYLGDVTGFPNNAFLNAADIGNDGIIYIRNVSDAGIYSLDINDLSSLNAVKVCDFPKRSGIQNNVGDLAFNPNDNKFYGTRDDSNILLKYDITNCTVDSISTSVNMSSANGAFYISADGTGYGYQNANGQLLRIDLISGLIDTVGISIPTSQTDGCSCEGLKFFKDVSSTCTVEDDVVTYEFSIFNNWFADLTNVSFKDTMTNGLIWHSNPYDVAGGSIGAANIVGSQYGNFTITSLPRGTMTFKIDVKIPANYTGPQPNLSQAFLSDLPEILVPYKKSDYPATPQIDDPTPLNVAIKPTIVVLNTTVCEGTSVDLSASSPSAVSYLWSANAGGVNTPIATVLPTPPSSTYNVTVTNGAGCTADAQVVINALPKPTINLTGPNSICIGTNTSLSASATGIWTAINPTIANINASGVITGLSAGQARFVFTQDGTNCKSDTFAAVIVNPKPVIQLIGPSTICKSSTTQLNPSSGGTWTSTDPAVATVNDQGLVTGVKAGTASFVFQSDATGCSSDPSTQVTIEQGNGSTLTGPYTLCTGTTGQLSANPLGGIWTSLNPSIATVNSNTGLVTAIANGTANIQYNHNSGSCSLDNIKSIVVKSTPNVSNTKLNASCSEDNGAITFIFADDPDRTGLKLSIDNGANFTTVADNIGSYVFNNLSIGTYNLVTKWGNDECEVDLGQLTIIDSNPAPQTIVTHTDEPCGSTNGGSISLQVTNDPNQTLFSISIDGGVTFPYVVADNIGTYTISNLMPNTYDIHTKWNDNSCSKSVASVTIQSGFANIGNITADDTICYGANKVLIASGGSTYAWSHGPTTPSVTVNPQTTTTYTVTISQGNGCSEVKNSTVIVIDPLTVTLNFEGGLCLTENSKITAIHSGGLSPFTYSWAGPSGPAGNTKTVDINEGGNYYVTITDSKGCTAGTSGFIYQQYEPFIVNLQTAVCEGSSVDLNVSATDAISYAWSANTGGSTAPFVTVNPILPSSTYNVTVTNNIGCVAVAEAIVDVNPAPGVNLSGADEICVGGTTQLTSNGVGYWVSSNQSVAQVNSTGIVTGISGGTADFYFTEQTNYCTSLNPISITVLSDGIQGFSTDEMCIGDTTYLLPNTGGVWSAVDPSIFSVTQEGRVIALASGSGKFQFAINGSACIATTFGEITVNPKPIVNIGGGEDICLGTTTYITPTSGGIWTSTNPTVASIDNNGTITGLSIGTATFVYESNDTGCSSDESDAITVSQTPVPTVVGPTSICVGGNTNLLPNSGGVWQSTDPSIATITSSGLVNGVYPGTAKFIFVADGGICISDTSEAITVLTKPTTTLTGDDALCIGETTNFTPATGGKWYSTNTDVATITDNGQVIAIGFGTVRFIYENDITSCTSDPSDMITIYDKPVINLTGTDTICIGSLTTLSPTTGGVWTSSNPSVALVSSSGIVTGLSSGTVTLTFKENQNDCASDPSEPITILPRPVVQITGPTEICQGATTSLSPTVGGYWISSNNSIATVSETGVVTGLNQGLVRFTFVSDLGCTSNQSAPIIIKAKPSPIFLGSPSICIDGTINLLPNTGGTWVSSDTTVATITNGGIVTGKKQGLATFVFYDNNTGCTSDPSGQLIVNGKPTISILPGARLCVGANMNVSPSVGGTWSSNDNTIATISNSGVITALAEGTVSFQFQNLSTGCLSDMSAAVIVDPKPAINLNGSASICVGDTSYMSPISGGTWTSNNPSVAAINNNGQFIGLTGGIARFKFTSANNCPSDLSEPIIVNSAPVVGLTGPQFICIGNETSVYPSSGGSWYSSDTTIATITNNGIVVGLKQGGVNLTYVDNITGCESNGQLEVNILPPPIITLDGDSDICMGYTTNVSASSTGYWISSDIRIATVTNDGVITGVAPGVASFTFVDGLTSCSNDGETIEINVSKCINHDFNVTLNNTEVLGDMSTNDNIISSAVYNGLPILKSKPAGSIYDLNINTDGTYDFTANKAGKYLFEVQVCVSPLDFGCPTSILEITVLGDIYSQNVPVNNLEFVTTFAHDDITLQGDYVEYSAMSNDLCVNGSGCDLSMITPSITTNAINGNDAYLGLGKISYTPAAGHLGKEVLSYRVCSDLDPINCSTSSTFITVASRSASNMIVAPDDFMYTSAGVTVTGNVMANDSDPEGDLLSVTPAGSSSSPISITGGSYFIESNGDYTFVPNSNFSGPTSFIYTICDDNVDMACMDATVYLIVLGDMSVSIKVYLEGALVNNGNENSELGKPLMRDNLRKSPFNGKNYIPTTDPYTTGTGLYGHGIKNHIGPGLLSSNQVIQDSAGVFGVTGSNAIVDWVYLELRSKDDMSLAIATRSALLQRDGDVVDLDGISPVRFNGIGVDSFYIVVSHRLHTGAMSGLVSNTETVDFTNINTQTHNFGYYSSTGFDYTGLTFNKNIKNGYNALWAGDFNSNGTIGFVGGDDDSNVIITDVLLHPNNVELKANFDFAYGYFNGDYDMNAKVKYTNPSDDTNMLFTQVLLYGLNNTFASNFGAMIEQVPPRSN